MQNWRSHTTRFILLSLLGPVKCGTTFLLRFSFSFKLQHRALKTNHARIRMRTEINALWVATWSSSKRALIDSSRVGSTSLALLVLLSSIGASTAIAFAKEGAHVAIVGRNEANLKQTSEKISKIAKKPLVIKADVSKDEDLKTIIKKTVDIFGKLDILVNNAGILGTATITDENLPTVYDDVMNTNLRSAVLLTNLATPHLIKTKGNIVNISSVAGTSALSGFGEGYSAYCISKAGMNHFSRVVAMELAEKGVRVNVVSPGPVETPILDGTGVTDMEVLAAMTALKRLSQPEEIADVVLFLASDKARSITGSNYMIDCGMTLRM